MSTLGEKFRKNPLLFLLLGAAMLWVTYRVLEEAAPAVFLQLDGSYGRLGGSFGYALLGLGLGAAAGAIAAQRRYRLNRAILAGAAGLMLLLAYLASLGSTGTSTYISASDLQPAETSVAEVTDSSSANEPADASTPQAILDTSSTAVQEWRQVTERMAPMHLKWADSLRAPVAYLYQGDTVRLLRRAHGWAQVVSITGTPLTGWVRLAGLGAMAGREEQPKAAVEPEKQTAVETDEPAVDAPEADESGVNTPEASAASIEHPTGHREHHGQVGQLYATYSLDWQTNGELSGSYFYNEKPNTIYRLTGSVSPSGELHLLEFTRGRQSARCTLQWQGNGYQGTMHNTDGQQFDMTLE